MPATAKATPTKRTLRALKSMYRDQNERSLYDHEDAETDRLIDLEWAEWTGDGDYDSLVLTMKGMAKAKALGF